MCCHDNYILSSDCDCECYWTYSVLIDVTHHTTHTAHTTHSSTHYTTHCHVTARYHAGGPLSIRGFGGYGIGPRAPPSAPSSTESAQDAITGDALGGFARSTFLATLSVPINLKVIDYLHDRISMLVSVSTTCHIMLPLFNRSVTFEMKSLFNTTRYNAKRYDKI